MALLTYGIGTCTDVHETQETKLAAKRTREQLLSVIAHSHVTIFTVNRDHQVTMLEGALIWDATVDESDAIEPGRRWYINQHVEEVFNRLNPKLKQGERPPFLGSISDVISGKVPEDIVEHGIGKSFKSWGPMWCRCKADLCDLDDRWYRTRFLPIFGKKDSGDNDNGENDNSDAGCDPIEGVIGLIMDVTELKSREADIERQAEERRLLVANEAAAKEASRLKSQFLANVRSLLTPYRGARSSPAAN